MKLIRDKRKLDKNFVNQCTLKIQQALKLVKNIGSESFSISAQEMVNKIWKNGN